MGVTGLWKLIEPTGKPVPVETLEGKILAVDISIWLHQVVKGFQDNKGSALANAHLLGLFHRLCKLLYYRVRPVFVFDGCVPQLKRDTIARRMQQRSKLNTEAERIQALVLQSLAKEKVVQQALGAAADLLLKSPVKRGSKATSTARKDPDELFKLPELPPPSASKVGGADAEESDTPHDSSFDSFSDDYTTASTSADDSSFDESNPRYAYNNNLQSIDVRSQHFRQLPADVRHEILVDIKETRKQSSWGRLHEFPARGDDFSTFQMNRLLKRRAVQESLEAAEQEMGGRTLTYAELTNMFTEEGIVEPSEVEKGAKPICSDENTRFLLVRDLKKKLAKVEEIKNEEVEAFETAEIIKTEEKVALAAKQEDLEQPSTSAQAASKALDTEYDADLAMAIALSLDESGGGGDGDVYRERDYDFEEGEELKLNRAQRKQLEGAAKGPARAYMIEYGGMNEDEVAGIMEKTQLDAVGDIDALNWAKDESYAALIAAYQTDEDKATVQQKEEPETVAGASEEFKLQVSDSDGTDSDFEAVEPMESTIRETISSNSEKPESQELRLRVSDASDTDSDLEEVTTEPSKPKILMEIVLDLKNTEEAPEDDLFADIFEVQKVEKGIQNKIELNAPKSQEVILIESQSDVENAAPIAQIKNLNNSAQELQRSILDELKKQVEDVKKINLDDIKVNNASIIEISDSEDFLPKETKAEIIEICDDHSKSPTLKTPSKNKSISEYFDTNYVIKRTPESSKKTDEAAEEAVPKVKSPFFVKRTPKSGEKRRTDSPRQSDSPTTKRVSKATKALFEDNEKSVDQAEAQQESGVAPLVNTEDLIKEAATLLKEQNTDAQLHAIATNLAKERQDLESERNRQNRMGMSISQRMNSECQELLRLFGVPYIVAPMEAEAQCAFLDNVATLTNGTITDDSDIWLFGGRIVYKNFFAQNKHVMEFRAEQIEKSFSCDRRKLIQLACLVGSDYTTGIHGIGAVTALEILASFSANATATTATTSNDLASNARNVLTTLSRFRDWWAASKSSAMPPGSSARLALLKKLKNIELHEGFPNAAVVEAYLTPTVDESTEAFSWGQPDVESIREFTRKTFGWTTSKTDDILNPVIKKINEKKSQATIRNYFSVKSALSSTNLRVSKRVQGAIDRMSGKAIEAPEKPKAKAKRAATRKRKQTTTTEANEEVVNDNEVVECMEAKGPTTSSAGRMSLTSPTAQQVTKPTAKIANTEEVIPQREVTREKMRQNKERAAAVLRSSAAAAKKKRKS